MVQAHQAITALTVAGSPFMSSKSLPRPLSQRLAVCDVDTHSNSRTCATRSCCCKSPGEVGGYEKKRESVEMIVTQERDLVVKHWEVRVSGFRMEIELPTKVRLYTAAASPLPSFPFVSLGMTFNEKSTCFTPWCMLEELMMSMSSQT